MYLFRTRDLIRDFAFDKVTSRQVFFHLLALIFVSFFFQSEVVPDSFHRQKIAAEIYGVVGLCVCFFVNEKVDGEKLLDRLVMFGASSIVKVFIFTLLELIIIFLIGLVFSSNAKIWAELDSLINLFADLPVYVFWTWLIQRDIRKISEFRAQGLSSEFNF
jgi:hypothetical protein